jgi:hypothetical protein
MMPLTKMANSIDQLLTLAGDSRGRLQLIPMAIVLSGGSLAPWIAPKNCVFKGTIIGAALLVRPSAR